MKSLLFSITIILFAVSAQAQTLNWGSPQQDYRHIISASIGIEHGAIIGIGCGYKVGNSPLPVVLTANISMPSGEDFADDFKTNLGAQIRWFEYNNVQFSTHISGLFRRYENNFARIENFGCEIGGALGYYRAHWYVAGEARFDKAIVSHFRHSDDYKENFPGVKDGWYEPSTGGNFFYGLQTGVSFRKTDIFLRAGKVLSQDFSSTPTLPFYGQLGYSLRI